VEPRLRNRLGRKWRASKLVIICIAILFPTLPFAQTIFKCTDANGTVMFSKYECGKYVTVLNPGNPSNANAQNLSIPAEQSAGPWIEATLVLLPHTWDHKSSLPVAIWLHGYRANPTDLSASPHYQAAADALGIAIVGVPATRAEDPSSFIWAIDTRLDSDRVEQALKEASRRTGVNFSRRVLFGFSQGAVVALELAARFPRRYAGAIALSPGGNTYTPPMEGTLLNKQQTYFISIGAGELDRRVQLARQYLGTLKNLGAHVQYREVAGMSEHTRPPDWSVRFREWTAAILGMAN